ncbi:hypothetical protein DXG01_008964 [Tephrocybe rancida]|nr:hypothetical protein DXG01_008964 [Tephrocybe rancida]
MHHCLQIQEILHNIFSSLSLDPKGSIWPLPGSGALFSLALTCRAFSGLALDELWHFQPSILYLLRCLPDDCIEIAKSGYIDVKRKLHWTDFARMRHYAPRVKEIIASHLYMHNNVDPTILPLIWADEELRRVIALPNLRRLWVRFEDFEGQALYPRLLMTSRVTSITVQNEDRDTPEVDFPWDNLAVVLAPFGLTLKSFVFDTEDAHRVIRYRTSACPEIMVLHHSFVSLHHLDTHNFMITHAALSHVATMPNLQSLSFGIKMSEAAKFLAILPGAADFPSLVNVRIDIEDLAIAGMILSRPGFRRLKSLTVLQSEVVPNTNWDFQTFFKSIHDHQESRVTLEVLNLLDYSDYSSPPRVEPLPLAYNALSYLLPFSSLSTLKITHKLMLDLDDTQLSTMSKAWPHIRVLCLRADYRDLREPSLSFAAVVRFACRAKQLQMLKIRSDATNLPRFADSGDFGTASALSHLDMSTSPIDSPHEFATLLLMTCPALKRLSYAMKFGNDLSSLSTADRPLARSWQYVTTIIRRTVSTH